MMGRNEGSMVTRLKASMVTALLLAACGDNGAKTTVSTTEDTAVDDTADTAVDDTADTAIDDTTDTAVDDTTDTAIDDTTDTTVDDTTDTAIDDTTVDTTPPPFPACPRYSAGVSAGFVTNLSIREASGVAASRRYGNVLWVHNDSGDTNRVFAIATNGASFATYVLGGAEAVAVELAAYNELTPTEDRREGVAAWGEKRKAAWKGR